MIQLDHFCLVLNQTYVSTERKKVFKLPKAKPSRRKAVGGKASAGDDGHRFFGLAEFFFVGLLIALVVLLVLFYKYGIA
tara:strand:- start:770 stop:1006 length:237 start_codon:yes stop_codon:yes gene_type:complete